MCSDNCELNDIEKRHIEIKLYWNQVKGGSGGNAENPTMCIRKGGSWVPSQLCLWFKQKGIKYFIKLNYNIHICICSIFNIQKLAQ